MLLQCINVILLPIETTEELVLFFVDICIPCMVVLYHGLSICLDLSQVLLHLVLLLFQMISLKYPRDQSPELGTKDGELPESSPQPEDPRGDQQGWPSTLWIV